jgi:hypothetical protein
VSANFCALGDVEGASSRDRIAIVAVITSMRRHSQVKTPWRIFFVFLQLFRSSVKFFCVNDSPTSADFRPPSAKHAVCSDRSKFCATELAGDPQGGGSPLEGGAGSIDACQRFLLARSVLPAWGDTLPPRLSPGGNRKGGMKSLLPQAISCHSALFRFRTA